MITPMPTAITTRIAEMGAPLPNKYPMPVSTIMPPTSIVPMMSMKLPLIPSVKQIPD